MVVGRLTAKGSGFSFWNDYNVLKLIVLMVTQFYEHTKSHKLYVFNR